MSIAIVTATLKCDRMRITLLRVSGALATRDDDGNAAYLFWLIWNSFFRLRKLAKVHDDVHDVPGLWYAKAIFIHIRIPKYSLPKLQFELTSA